MTDSNAKSRSFAEILNEIVLQSETVPEHEIIGFIKGAIQNVPGLSAADRAALFNLATRAGAGVRPLERGDLNVNVHNVQNANSSATASPHVSQSVNLPPTASSGIGLAALSHEEAGGSGAAELSQENRDGLTKLLRREVLDAELPIRFADAESTGNPLSLIMLDIDKFKAVNDTHGHAKGDEVLKDVARCVEMTVAGKGVAYRYGGEEITIVLPNHDAQEAAAVAERLRTALQALKPGGLSMTASLGVASFPLHVSTQEELLARADKALYAAKDGGRNLVRVHGDGEPQAAEEGAPSKREPAPDGLSES